MVYLLFRCDCGRVLYSKDTNKTRKCSCGKTLQIKKRRILKQTDNLQDAIKTTQDMQEEIHGGTGFMTADKL